MEGKELLFLFWIPKTPHIWITCVFSSLVFCFLHRLGADSENVLEKTPMRSKTQKILAHRHERDKVCDGVGRKVMELGSKEVQETSEKRVRRKRETMVDMGGEQNALTRSRLRLHLPLRQPCNAIGD